MYRSSRIAIFLALTALFSLPWWWLAREYGGGSYIALLMWSPAIAAVTTLKLTSGQIGELGWRGAEAKWLAGAWLLTLVSLCLANFPVFWAGVVGFPDPAAVAEQARKLGISGAPATLILLWFGFLLTTGGMLRLASLALGEELGWRGLLVPEACARFGFVRGSLFTGLVWAVWHYPLMIGKETPIHIVNFTLTIMGMGVAYAWFRLKSNSVWPTTVMHGLHNALIPFFFTNLAIGGPAADAWLDETGYALAGMGVILGIVFLWLGFRAPLLASGSVQVNDSENGKRRD